MKNIRLVLLAVILLMVNTVTFGENDPSGADSPSAVSVTGTVVDKHTNETLPGVTIQLVDSESKIYTNPDGTFSLNGLQPGEYEVRLSCISYKDTVVTLDVKRSTQNTLSVQLESVEP